MDSLTPERRSWNMSRIRGKDTRPEKLVRSLLHNLGYRFRLNRKDVLVSRIFFFPSTRPHFLFTAAIGTDIKDAIWPTYQKVMSSSGVENLRETLNAMPR